MVVFSHLSFLEGYFHRVVTSKRSPRELYEMVQHAGNVLPRLYLMITAGGTLIRSRKTSTSLVLKDMCEMCRGVQHPTRGLFLRYYLLQKAGPMLPERGSVYESEESTVTDAVNFVLENVVEMVRLWVRMQTSADVKGKKRRSRERREIRQVIGTGLDKLASIEGLDATTYSAIVLPAVMEELVTSRDALAQEFLFDCVLQAFPVEFHLATLDQLLAAAAQVEDDVSVRDLLTGMFRRITSDSGALAGSADICTALLQATRTAVTVRGARIGAAAVADIFAALVAFAARAYPGDLVKTDTILASCAELVFLDRPANEAGLDGVARLLSSLWADPEAGGSAVAATSAGSAAAAGSVSLRGRAGETVAAGLPAKEAAMMSGVASLIGALDLPHRRAVGSALAEALARQRASIATVGECESILTTLAPLIRDESGSAAAPAGEEEEADMAGFVAEQEGVARLVRCLGRGAASLKDQFDVVCAARTAFGHGRARRIVFTLPALVVRLLEVYKEVEAVEAAGGDTAGLEGKRLMRTTHETCAALSSAHPHAALRLFLLCGRATGGQSWCHTFFSEALLLHEDVPESALQRSSLLATIGALSDVGPGAMGVEVFEQLAKRCATFAARLLRKAHAVECALAGAKLFWTHRTPLPVVADARDASTGPESAAAKYENPEALKQCLSKAEGMAEDAIPRHRGSYVDIVETYVYLFERQCTAIEAADIVRVVQLARERLAESSVRDEASVHFDAIIDHIKAAQQRAAHDAAFAMWAGVSI